jgi:hypothetical protein
MRLIEELVNKMLEKHNIDYDYVKKNPEVNGVEWYRFYTFTKQESEEFKSWAIDLIKKRLRMSEKSANYEFDMFNLSYGLRIEEE